VVVQVVRDGEGLLGLVDYATREDLETGEALALASLTLVYLITVPSLGFYTLLEPKTLLVVTVQPLHMYSRSLCGSQTLYISV
jgi:hypothetical protein